MSETPVNDIFSLLAGLTLILLGFSVYMLPTAVAVKRNHPQMVGVMLLNLLLGWTFFAWVGALIWAVKRS